MVSSLLAEDAVVEEAATGASPKTPTAPTTTTRTVPPTGRRSSRCSRSRTSRPHRRSVTINLNVKCFESPESHVSQKDEWNNNFEDEVKKTRSSNVASGGYRGQSHATASSSSAEDAQKKFGGAKGISSDMYFG